MVYHIPVEKFSLFVTIGAAVVFTALCLSCERPPAFIVAAVAAAIGAVFAWREKETVITVDEKDMTVTVVKNSRFLNNARPVTFAFGDVVRITRAATMYKSFHVVRLSSGKTVALPHGVNPKFDAFMTELERRLKETSPRFAATQEKEDEKQNRYRVVTIVCAAVLLPVCLIAAAFGEKSFYITTAVMAMIMIPAAVMTARH